MLFRGKSSKLELLIEKIQQANNKEISTDSIGSDPSLSWNSAEETVDEDQNSLSPSSCTTPNSVITEGNDPELHFTIGPTENTPYSCQFCEKSFPRLSYLKKHEQSHSDQMPFKCDFCQRLFKHKRSRDRHVKLHTGDKKYRCPHCESAFSRSDHLKIHMKTHDNQKPYQCVICNRGYNTAAALTSHMQNHKKESLHGTPSPGQFRCLQCTGSFHTGEELQAHVSLHHRPISSSTPEKPEGGNNSKRHSSSPRTPSSSPNSGSNHGGGTNSNGSSCHSGRLRSTVPELEHSSSNSLILPFPIIPKLTCIYCTKDSFTTMESLQLHVQAMHGSLLNGDLSESPHRLSPIGTPPGASPTENLASAVGHFPCHFCTMKFSSLTSLHKHSMSVHSLSGYFQAKAKENVFCAQCAIAFPNGLAFAEHFLIFHTNSSQHSNNVQAHVSSKPTQVCSPEPPQMKPTDLSKKSKIDESSSSSSTCSSPASSSFLGDAAKNNARSSSGSEKRMTTTKSVRKSKKPTSVIPEDCSNSIHAASSSSITIPSPNRLAHHRQCILQSPSLIIPSSITSPTATGAMSFGPHSLLCNQCNAGFPDFESFRTHLKSHLEEITHKFICDKCDSEFDSEEQLEAHGMGHYLTTTTEYGCQSCLKLFGKPDELQKHLMDIHAHHLYRCALCKDMFDSKVSIQVHFAVKHSNECKLFRCTSCATMFRTEAEFQVHVKMSHLRKLSPYRCLLCNATFRGELDLQFHLNTHQKQFRCKLCDEAFHVEFLLDKHMQSHQMNGCLGDPRISPSGDRLLSAAAATSPGSSLSNHLPPISNSSANNVSSNSRLSKKGGLNKSGNQSQNHKELKCDICDKIAVNELELTSHRKQVHHISISSPMSITASSSAPGSNNNNNVPVSSNKNQHHSTKLKSTHHQNPNSTTNNNNGLNSSNSAVSTTSTTTLSLHCAYCNENCKNRSDLENHMKSHQIISSGKHKCNICDEVCPTATLLAEHKLTHCKVVSGSNCTSCKQSLGSEEQFYSHMKLHCGNNNCTSNNNNSSSTAGGSSSSYQLPMPCIVCRQTLMSEIEIQMHAKFHTKQYLENNNNNNHMLMMSPNASAYGNSSSTHGLGMNSNGILVQCSHCLRFEDKSQFLVNGFNLNGLQSHICQECFRKRSNNASSTSTKSKKSRNNTIVPNNNSSTNQVSTSPDKDVSNLNRNENNSKTCSRNSTSPSSNNSSCGNSNNNNNHSNNHSKSKTYQCIKCQMSFNTEDEICNHVATTHLTNEDSKNECHLCRQITYFDSPLKLQCHLIQHDHAGCPSFTCYMCSAVFTTAAGLQQHIFEHGFANKIYDCSKCHLKFYFRAELENHILSSHEDVKKAMIELDRYSNPANLAHFRNISDAFLAYGSNINVNFSEDFHGFQRDQSHTPGQNNKNRKSSQKRKKFFYRSDDSDEEMMESQLGRESFGSMSNNSNFNPNKLHSKDNNKAKYCKEESRHSSSDLDLTENLSNSNHNCDIGNGDEVFATQIKKEVDLDEGDEFSESRQKRRVSKGRADSVESEGLDSKCVATAPTNHDIDEEDQDPNTRNIDSNGNNCNGNRAHQNESEDDNNEAAVVKESNDGEQMEVDDDDQVPDKVDEAEKERS